MCHTANISFCPSLPRSTPARPRPRLPRASWLARRRRIYDPERHFPVVQPVVQPPPRGAEGQHRQRGRLVAAGYVPPLRRVPRDAREGRSRGDLRQGYGRDQHARGSRDLRQITYIRSTMHAGQLASMRWGIWEAGDAGDAVIGKALSLPAGSLVPFASLNMLLSSHPMYPHRRLQEGKHV